MTRSKNTIKVPTEKMTSREIEVITFTAIGKTRSEISKILTLSEETVKVYVERACRKLNAVNKANAITIAMTLGLIAPYKCSELRGVKVLEVQFAKKKK
jgi:DNA-binding CsgD family transcriptional regulator